MTKHAELIARLEAAEVGSYTLDAEIWDIEDSRPRHDLGEEYPIYKRCLDDSVAFDSPPPYTTSLDAAIALAERVLPGWFVGIQHNRGVENASQWSSYIDAARRDEICGDAHTPALALCIAILKALEGE